MFDKMKQLYDMQKQARQMKKTVETFKLEKASSDGKIRVVMNGAFAVEALSIDPSLLRPENKADLEKALQSLLTETAEGVAKESAQQAMAMMKEMNFKLPGM
jgi:DNA-binding YbaB/EbfC family protein